MELFRLAYKNIIHRKARFILTTLSVVVGVMFVAGTFIFTDGLRNVFTVFAQDISGESDILVRSKLDFGNRVSAPPVPVVLKEDIEKVKGVQRVEVGITDFGLTLQNLDQETIDPVVIGTPTIGLAWDDSVSSGMLILETGRRPAIRGEFAVDIATATEKNMNIGEQYIVLVSTGKLAGPHTVTLVGTLRVDFASNSEDFSAQIIAFDTQSAVDLYNDGKGYDQYEVFLEPGANKVQVIADIEATLASSPTSVGALNEAGIKVEVISTKVLTEEFTSDFNSFIDLFRNILLGFAFVILLVSAFVIFNTFSIILDQRIKELGFLRAVGLSGKQLQVLVLGEAFIVGLVSTIIGFAASFGIFYAFVAFLEIQSGGDFPTVDLIIQARTILMALAVGVGLTILSTLPIAIRSKRVSPVAALREGVSAARQTEVKRNPITGLIVLAIGVTLAVLTLFLSWGFIIILSILASFALYWGGSRLGKWTGHIIVLVFGVAWLAVSSGAFKDLDLGESITFFGLGVVLVFLGVNLISPLFGVQLARGFGAPIRALYRTVGKLGVGNAARNPKRTATTAAALMIGVALLSVASITTSSIKASFSSVLEGLVNSDLIVCQAACEGSDDFPTLVNGKIRELPTVKSTAAFSVQGEGFKVVGSQTNSVRNSYSKIVDVTGSSLNTIDQHLNLGTVNNGADISVDNGVYVYDDRAKEYNLEIGSDLFIEFADGTTSTLKVVGIFGGTNVFGEWIVNSSILDEKFSNRRDFIVSILLVDASAAATDQAISDIGFAIRTVHANLGVKTPVEYNEDQVGDLNNVLVVISVFLGFSFVVALLGIANTLALSIFERTREIGLLRAIGMKRKQVRGMIYIEGFIIGIFGSVLGIILGVAYGRVLVQVIPDEFISEFAIQPGQIILYGIIGGIIGLVSTLFPAIRAGRIDILRSISQE